MTTLLTKKEVAASGRLITDLSIFGPSWAGARFGFRFYEPEPGDVVEQWYPFTRMAAIYYDAANAPALEERWRPGVWAIEPGAYDCNRAYHAEGGVRYVVKAVVPVPGYPRRILYTRQFIDPDGKPMTKSGLLCHSITKFRAVVAGLSIDAEKSPDLPPVKEGSL